PAFAGKSKASLIAAILSAEPPAVSTLMPLSPPAFDQLVKTCLEKDPDHRWQNARDVKHQLLWIQKSSLQEKAQITGRAKANWSLVGAAAMLGAALAAGVLWRFDSHQAIDPPSPARFAITLRPGESIEARSDSVVAISPDGRTLAYAANREDERGLYLRS